MSESPALSPQGPIRPALIAAGIVAVVMLLIDVVGVLFGQLPWQFFYGGNAADTLAGFGWNLVEFILPFAVGVWLSLWLLLPMHPGQRLVTVLIRAVVASATGAVLAYLAGIAIRLFQAGNQDFFAQLVGNLFGIVSTAVSSAPLVALVLVIQHLVLPRGQRV